MFSARARLVYAVLMSCAAAAGCDDRALVGSDGAALPRLSVILESDMRDPDTYYGTMTVSDPRPDEYIALAPDSRTRAVFSTLNASRTAARAAQETDFVVRFSSQTSRLVVSLRRGEAGLAPMDCVTSSDCEVVESLILRPEPAELAASSELLNAKSAGLAMP